VVIPEKRLLPETKHGLEHHIRVKDEPPISSKFRRLDPEKFAAAKAEFDQLEREGIIRRSDSPHGSPLHMVKKPDGYRRLNLIIIPDAYPLPNVMNFAPRISGCTIFSKVVLRKGYHQIPMHSTDSSVVQPLSTVSPQLIHSRRQRRQGRTLVLGEDDV
jgi:hypothetical protein